MANDVAMATIFGDSLWRRSQHDRITTSWRRFIIYDYLIPDSTYNVWIGIISTVFIQEMQVNCVSDVINEWCNQCSYNIAMWFKRDCIKFYGFCSLEMHEVQVVIDAAEPYAGNEGMIMLFDDWYFVI